ncbi:MAG: ATP-binding protein [Candidatus Daviesbacteria bacterium]|nr:ATP-binding protein [Candidatus Daviesbacteria bacterium]
MRPTLYILCGLPYSGKTTLRKALVKRLNLVYVSVDEIMKAKDMWRSGHPTQDDWNIAYSEAYEKLKGLLKQKRNVILDLGNLEFQERETARQIAEALEAKYILIYVNTPIEEITRRRKENKVTKIRGHLEDSLLKSAIDKFNKPSAEENPIIYNSQENIDEWIKQNI